MTLSMFQASVPRLINGLTNLSNILGKAQAHAEAKKIDPTVFASMRLYPDMFPLSRQVQIACDVSKGLVARLAGVEIPNHEDTEKDLKDLQARIAKTIAFLETFKPEQIELISDLAGALTFAIEKASLANQVSDGVAAVLVTGSVATAGSARSIIRKLGENTL